MRINILHAEFQTLSRIRLKEILLKTAVAVSYSETLNSKDLFQRIKVLPPDVIVINYYEGSTFCEADIFRIRTDYPEIKILVLSSDNLNSRVKAVIQSGIGGYVFSDAGEQEIINAVFAVARGEKIISNKVIDVIINEPNALKKEWVEEKGISQREIEIIKMLAFGSTNKLIASQLNLSHHTVHTHRRNIMKKLNLKTISELTLFAFKSGLIEDNT